jgi:hypothetical protein
VGLTVRVAFLKKGLKIPKGLPEAVNPVVTSSIHYTENQRSSNTENVDDIRSSGMWF